MARREEGKGGKHILDDRSSEGKREKGITCSARMIMEMERKTRHGSCVKKNARPKMP